MSEELEDFIDADSQVSNSKDSSFKEIIMTHIGRIGTICTKEFRRGYWEKRPVKVGDAVHIIETYKEDTRDAYINAVDFLYDLLLPRLYTDEDNIKLIRQEIDRINLEMKKESSNNLEEEVWKAKRLEYRRLIFQQLSLLLKELLYLDRGSMS